MSFLSSLTVTSIGLTCKAFLLSPLTNTSVNNLHILKNALSLNSRNNGQGIITVCNHISTLDDPVTWGVLPASYYLSSRTTRWGLGASEVMFTNPVFSAFFRLGQILETFRGQGIYQPSVDAAISKLNQGHWPTFRDSSGACKPTYLFSVSFRLDNQFKIRSGRILMSTTQMPVVIPMWISGFDRLMPEGRPFPYKYLPHMGVDLSVTFGEPIDPELLKRALLIPRDPAPSTIHNLGLEPTLGGSTTQEHLEGWSKNLDPLHDEDALRTSLIRQQLTSIVHDHVQKLGYSVSGPLLGAPPPPP
ncbi:hypothetical protein CVT24_002041 [Panaeolus cyanescens]|uniref:Tafazzin family protein n=1 Tax=Panaeolus cyanescens TaxID=181874 RepID=A0A409YHN0_9AGAR|nr:hypothetical protein CVT24_002041 [Panaeolus cyanescens]